MKKYENKTLFKKARKEAKKAIREGRVPHSKKHSLIDNLYGALENNADLDLCIEGFKEEASGKNDFNVGITLADINAKAREIRDTANGETWQQAIKRASALLKGQ
jgi:hypothetical protein